MIIIAEAVDEISEGEEAEEENAVVSVMFVDIDDFRKVNDGFGLIVGDELIQVFGQFLNDFRSDNVMVSHFNSDLYCMAIYDPCGNRGVEQPCAREIRSR